MIEVGQRSRFRTESIRTETALLGFLRSWDWILFAAAAGLVGYGLWVVSGITRFDVPGDENYFVVRQAVAAVVGGGGLVVAALVPLGLWRRDWKGLYGGRVAPLFSVFVGGGGVPRSQRRVGLGGLSV